MTPEDIDQLWTEHEHAVAQQRQDREDLATKELRDAEWGEEIELRWGKR
jgi:hypothetical protein